VTRIAGILIHSIVGERRWLLIWTVIRPTSVEWFASLGSKTLAGWKRRIVKCDELPRNGQVLYSEIIVICAMLESAYTMHRLHSIDEVLQFSVYYVAITMTLRCCRQWPALSCRCNLNVLRCLLRRFIGSLLVVFYTWQLVICVQFYSACCNRCSCHFNCVFVSLIAVKLTISTFRRRYYILSNLLRLTREIISNTVVLHKMLVTGI